MKMFCRLCSDYITADKINQIVRHVTESHILLPFKSLETEAVRLSIELVRNV